MLGIGKAFGVQICHAQSALGIGKLCGFGAQLLLNDVLCAAFKSRELFSEFLRRNRGFSNLNYQRCTHIGECLALHHQALCQPAFHELYELAVVDSFSDVCSTTKFSMAIAGRDIPVSQYSLPSFSRVTHQ